jgi:glycosyltransferase involved in cell wall biosynthesis
VTATTPRPRVSILLPVFDAEATLAACLHSIRRQTEPRWRCVVVDDGSQDGSLACARRFAQRDARFLVVARPHRGLVAALQAGLEHCEAPCIARMDADDWMHRRRLAEQLGWLEDRPGLAAVGSHVRLFPRAALGEGMREYERWLSGIDSPRRVREEAFVECPVAHPTLAIRRETLLELGYRDCGWPEDYDLILRLLEGGHEVGVVPRRLLGWRHGPARLSRRSPSYAIERFTACKAAYLARGFLAASDRYVLWGYGATGKALARELRRLGKRPSAIVELHPGRLGETIQGAPVIRAEQLGGLPSPPVVVSVAGAPARSEIRADLARLGFRELRDYVCAA